MVLKTLGLGLSLGRLLHPSGPQSPLRQSRCHSSQAGRQAGEACASPRLSGHQPGLTHALCPAELSRAEVQRMERDQLDEPNTSDSEVGTQPHTGAGLWQQGCPRLGGRVLPLTTPPPPSGGPELRGRGHIEHTREQVLLCQGACVWPAAEEEAGLGLRPGPRPVEKRYPGPEAGCGPVQHRCPQPTFLATWSPEASPAASPRAAQEKDQGQARENPDCTPSSLGWPLLP